jgi:hypothetical protein
MLCFSFTFFTWQGLEIHSLISFSQVLPSYPGWHLQLNRGFYVRLLVDIPDEFGKQKALS